MKRAASGSNEVVRKASQTACDVQDAVNLIAIVGTWHRLLKELREAGCCGDDLNNHPVSLAFVSKLKSLTRIEQDGREFAALDAVEHLAAGEDVEYEVIPL